MNQGGWLARLGGGGGGGGGGGDQSLGYKAPGGPPTKNPELGGRGGGGWSTKRLPELRGVLTLPTHYGGRGRCLSIFPHNPSLSLPPPPPSPYICHPLLLSLPLFSSFRPHTPLPSLSSSFPSPGLKLGHQGI